MGGQFFIKMVDGEHEAGEDVLPALIWCIAVNNGKMDEIWQLVADGTPIVSKP
jgi:hypothetical protein